MDAPYYVEENGRRLSHGYASPQIEYAIHRVGEGPLVTGTDLVLLHKIIELLNDEINGRDIHR